MLDTGRHTLFISKLLPAGTGELLRTQHKSGFHSIEAGAIWVLLESSRSPFRRPNPART
jgi:hypothetical protein